MGCLKDKTAVVLGASNSGGMGHRIAERFLSEGAKVMIAARSEDNVRDLASQTGALAAVCDITSEESVEKLAATALEAFGNLDIAVNAAGQPIMGDIATAKEKYVRKAVDVHFIGPMFFLKHMSAAIDRDGSIITLSSITATRVIGNHAAYMGAKAGTDHVVRAAAIEFGPRNIRVNSVSPGFTASPMTEAFLKLDGLRETFEAEIPLGRLNTPEDVAHVCACLCDDRSYVTGQNIQVNGGNSLTRLPTDDEFAALSKNKT